MGQPEYIVTDTLELVTLDGTDGSVKDDGYTPITPTWRLRASTTAGTDGGEIDGADYENVSATLVAHLTGTTPQIRATVQRLIRLFDRARRYNDPGARPVWFKHRPDSAESWYRSQLLSGRVLYDKDALNTQILAASFTVTLIFTRRFFFEADAESELYLMAEGDMPPGATGGKTITNHDDSGHGNFVAIAPGQVTGDTRVPFRLEMVCLALASVPLIYVGHEISDTLVFVAATLEGESATPLSNFVDANASNGNYNRLTWSGTAETDIATWAFTASDLINAQGRWHRVLARFAATFAYTDLYLRVKLLEGTTVIYQSEKQLMTATASLQEIASLPLPPNYLAAGSGVKLVLQATRLAGGSLTLDLDYLQLFTLSGWRKFYPLSGSGITQNAAVIDEGIGGYVYSLAGGVKAQDWSADGPALNLQPGPFHAQRLRFLWRRSDLAAPIADTMTVRAYYRARRLTI